MFLSLDLFFFKYHEIIKIIFSPLTNFFSELDLTALFTALFMLMLFKNLEQFSLRTRASCSRKASDVRRSKWRDQMGVTEELLPNGRRRT